MNFDRIAPWYRWLEWLFAGRKLQRCRTRWLDETTEAREVLIIGEGDGRFLAEAVQRMPEARFMVVDASAAMLRLAERRLGGEAGRVEFVQATLPGWMPPSERFDLVVMHFFLDCLSPEEFGGVVETLERSTKQEAKWLVADFRVPPEPGAARWRAKMIVGLAYAFFRLTTGLRARELVSPDPWLERAGFQRIGIRTWEHGLLFSECWRRDLPKGGTKTD